MLPTLPSQPFHLVPAPTILPRSLFLSATSRKRSRHDDLSDSPYKQATAVTPSLDDFRSSRDNPSSSAPAAPSSPD
ncbi:hypothetical protein MTO96_001052 [Rhipicephalus appendiculatus]